MPTNSNHLCIERYLRQSRNHLGKWEKVTYLSLISTERYVKSLGKVPGILEAFNIYCTEISSEHEMGKNN